MGKVHGKRFSGLRLCTDTIGWSHAVEHDQQDLTQDRRPHRSRRRIVRRHHRHSRALHVFPVDPEVAFLAIESLFTREFLRLTAPAVAGLDAGTPGLAGAGQGQSDRPSPRGPVGSRPVSAHVGQLIELRGRLIVHIGKGSSRDDGREVW